MLFHRSANVHIKSSSGVVQKLKSLRIRFDVTKTLTQATNHAQIEVFNLSAFTRNQIQELDSQVTLLTGYLEETGEEILFIGDISFILHSYDTPNIITKIECGDGEKVLRDYTISLSFHAGVYSNTLLAQIASSLDLPLKIQEDVVPKSFENKFAFIGPAKEALDIVCKKIHAEWSIQNNQLQIICEKGSVQNKIFHLSATTGLIGSPEKLQNIGPTLLGLKIYSDMVMASLIISRTAEIGLSLPIKAEFIKYIAGAKK